MKKFVSLALIFLTVGVFIAAGTSAYAQFAQSPQLKKFGPTQQLRNLQGLPNGVIPVAVSDGIRKWQNTVKATHYTIDIGQFSDKLHPDLPATTLWGFGQNFNINSPQWTKHLGGIIVAQKGQPVQITFRNRLTSNGDPSGSPLPNIIPVDTSLVGNNVATNRTAVHLHGGLVPWISDGGPFDWWTPGDNNGVLTGPSFLNNKVLNSAAKKNEAEYYYPNNQSARMVWYHDHAYGITRINAYAGIASAYVITDSYETQLTGAPVNLPPPVDLRTLYLVFQDKIFVNSTTFTTDPTWATVAPVVSQKEGSLWYAHFYDTNRWQQGPSVKGTPPNPSVIPEFFGDTILVNGSVYPTVTLNKTQYRLRVLNACNARFLNPRLVVADSTTGTDPDSYTSPTVAAGFIQIGNEGGFLPYPVDHSVASLSPQNQMQFVLAPAERADLILDLRNVAAGKYILYNDAPAPYPSGDDINDYYTNSPNNAASSTDPTKGPNTRTLMQIVVADFNPNDTAITLPATFTPTDPFLISQTPGSPSDVPDELASSMNVRLASGQQVTANVRRLTLNETFDQYGRLIQYLGTNAPQSINDNPPPPLAFGQEFLRQPTEVVNAGAYEIWEVANLTGDTHPIHIHLVNFQVLARASFDATNYSGVANTGTPVAPGNNELGYKETVRMNPGEVIWLFMKFDLPTVPFGIPTSPRMAAYGLGGKKTIAHEYVWHCHILEHEEHDMMRPLVVLQ